MPTYVRLVTYQTSGGRFHAEKDTRSLNEVLQELQDRKAKIISITPAVGGAFLQGIAAVYVIAYEAPTPI